MSEALDYQRPDKSDRADARSPLAALAPLLIAAIFAIAYAWRVRWPKWPVSDASERVVYWVLAAAVIGAVADLVRGRARLVATPVLGLIAAALCLWPNVEALRLGIAKWSLGQVAATVGVLSVVAAALATFSARLADRVRDRPLVPLVLLGMSLSSAPLAQATGSLKVGDASYCFAAAVALVALVVGLFVKPFARSAGVAIVVMAFVVTQLASGWGWFIPPMPIWCGVCILLAPLLAWSVALPPLAKRTTWLRVTVALLLAAIPASVAVGITAKAALSEHAAEAAEEAAW